MAKCLKCHGPVSDDQTICARCNPARLATPARTQFHGTLIVILVVIALVGAIVGPLFLGSNESNAAFGAVVIDEYRTSAEQVTVVVEVRNMSDSATAATCRVAAQDESGNLVATARTQTGIVGVGEVVTAEAVLDTSENPADVVVSC